MSRTPRKRLEGPGLRRDPVTNRVAVTVGELDFLESIGVGLFSRVRMVKHKAIDDTRFALKIYKKGEILKRDQVQHIKDEVTLLKRMSGPWFPTLHTVFQDEFRVYLLMGLIQGGELYSYLRQCGKLGDEQVLFYACQVVVIIQQLQDANVVHRDIKPENILFSRTGYLILVDFGLAKVVPDRTWTLCGTPEYVAPEVLAGKGYGKSVDWWALGVLVYEMVTGTSPFTDTHPFGIYKKIEECKPAYPSKLFTSAPCRDFVNAVLTRDRTQRLGAKRGASEVMEHRWFKKVDWDAIRNQQVPSPYRPQINGAEDLSNFDRYPESQLDPSIPLRAEDKAAFDEFFSFVDTVDTSKPGAGGELTAR